MEYSEIFFMGEVLFINSHRLSMKMCNFIAVLKHKLYGLQRNNLSYTYHKITN